MGPERTRRRHDDCCLVPLHLLEGLSMQTRNVAVLVGSLRQGSLNRKMALALAAIAPEGLALQVVEIGQLPQYNQDDDAHPPAASAAFKQRIAEADAVLFVTPEYN